MPLGATAESPTDICCRLLRPLPAAPLYLQRQFLRDTSGQSGLQDTGVDPKEPGQF